MSLSVPLVWSAAGSQQRSQLVRAAAAAAAKNCDFSLTNLLLLLLLPLPLLLPLCCGRLCCVLFSSGAVRAARPLPLLRLPRPLPLMCCCLWCCWCCRGRLVAQARVGRGVGDPLQEQPGPPGDRGGGRARGHLDPGSRRKVGPPQSRGEKKLIILLPPPNQTKPKKIKK